MLCSLLEKGSWTLLCQGKYKRAYSLCVCRFVDAWCAFTEAFSCTIYSFAAINCVRFAIEFTHGSIFIGNSRTHTHTNRFVYFQIVCLFIVCILFAKNWERKMHRKIYSSSKNNNSVQLHPESISIRLPVKEKTSCNIHVKCYCVPVPIVVVTVLLMLPLFVPSCICLHSTYLNTITSKMAARCIYSSKQI